MVSVVTVVSDSVVSDCVVSDGGTTSVEVGGRGGGVCGVVSVLASSTECRRESSLLFLLLVLGTVWLGLSLYNFTKTLVSRLILYTWICSHSIDGGIRFVANYSSLLEYCFSDGKDKY